jgi:hypothetical protein
MDVDILVTGGTGVAFGDLACMFLTVVVPLALDEARGFKVMVKSNALSAFAGLHSSLSPNSFLTIAKPKFK